MNEIKKLDEFQADALKEVGSIGMGNATMSLSAMLDRRIDLSLNSLRFLPLVHVPELVRNEDTVVGIIQEMKGDIKGYILFMMSKESTNFLIKSMLGEESKGESFNEMEQSVLKELCNIMSGTYITAVSNFLGISILLSPPSQVYDMAEAIVNQVVGMMSMDAENALFLRTEFKVHSEILFGKMIIFTDASSLSNILEVINRKANE
jgi:chemotaxis protein CheC